MKGTLGDTDCSPLDATSRQSGKREEGIGGILELRPHTCDRHLLSKDHCGGDNGTGDCTQDLAAELLPQPPLLI